MMLPERTTQRQQEAGNYRATFAWRLKQQSGYRIFILRNDDSKHSAGIYLVGSLTSVT
jgi:hypothetical protein